MIRLIVLFAILMAAVVAIVLGRQSRAWRRIVGMALTVPFVVSALDLLVPPRLRLEESLPETVLVRQGPRPGPDDVQGYLTRIIVFQGGNFGRPIAWAEAVVPPGGSRGHRLLDRWVSIECPKLVSNSWKGKSFYALRAELIVGDGGTGRGWVDYDDLDGLRPAATVAWLVPGAQRWASLVPRCSDLVVQALVEPIGAEGSRTIDRSVWWHDHHTQVSAACRAGVERGILQHISPHLGLPSFLERRADPTVIVVSLLLMLVILNSRTFALRDGSLMGLAWVTVALLVVRGTEATHVARLSAEDPEVRREAVHFILGENPRGDTATRIAFQALMDSDPRVVYEVLRSPALIRDALDLPAGVVTRLLQLSAEDDPVVAERASYVVSLRERSALARTVRP